MGRRNLSPEQMSLLRGRIYNRSKKQGARTDITSGQNVHKSTSDDLGERFGVSGKTVQRDGKFAESVESLKEHVPDIDARVMSGEVKRRDVLQDGPDPEVYANGAHPLQNFCSSPQLWGNCPRPRGFCTFPKSRERSSRLSAWH